MSKIKYPKAPAIKTPYGNLNYMYIKGEGASKSSRVDTKVFRGTVFIDAKELDSSELVTKLSDYWEGCKAVNPKIKGKFKMSKVQFGNPYRTSQIRLQSVATGELDGDGEEVYEDTGLVGITPWTNLTDYNGKPTKVTVYGVSASDAKTAKELGQSAKFSNMSEQFP